MATLDWQIATVTALQDETPRVKTLSLDGARRGRATDRASTSTSD